VSATKRRSGRLFVASVRASARAVIATGIRIQYARTALFAAIFNDLSSLRILRTVLRHPIILICSVICCCSIVNAASLAQAGADNDAEGQVVCDIPSQSLAQALEIFSDVTGWEVLYNSNLAAGRRSSAVRGAFAPEAALQALLAGTGLAVRHTEAKSVVLVAAPPGSTTRSVVSGAGDPAARRDYYGRIQLSLRDALCRSGDAHPGRYRFAAQFWIDDTGAVARYERLGSTGQPQTDDRIDQSLRNLRIGAPPPAGFAEPVTILIVPQASNVTLSCDSDRRRSNSSRVGP
jgi:hypothetical protein